MYCAEEVFIGWSVQTPASIYYIKRHKTSLLKVIKCQKIPKSQRYNILLEISEKLILTRNKLDQFMTHLQSWLLPNKRQLNSFTWDYINHDLDNQLTFRVMPCLIKFNLYRQSSSWIVTKGDNYQLTMNCLYWGYFSSIFFHDLQRLRR